MHTHQMLLMSMAGLVLSEFGDKQTAIISLVEQCKPEHVWADMAAGRGGWNCATNEWEAADCRFEPEAGLPALACPILAKYDRVVFHGDSVIRQFYQGFLIQVVAAHVCDFHWLMAR